MTQQPQYIITKEDYDQIYCIQYPLTSEERRRICERSRPAPSAPTDEQCRICSEAIRKDEREKVLDEAISAVESTNINDVEDARDAIESLRSSSEARE